MTTRRSLRFEPGSTLWVHRAACLDYSPELFESGRAADIRAARAICRQCPVREQCLDHTMRMEGADAAAKRSGVRAGRTPRERRRLYVERYAPERGQGLEAAWRARTRPLDGGHLAWTGPVTGHGVPEFRHVGRWYSARVVAFRMRTGRDPVGGGQGRVRGAGVCGARLCERHGRAPVGAGSASGEAAPSGVVRCRA